MVWTGVLVLYNANVLLFNDEYHHKEIWIDKDKIVAINKALCYRKDRFTYYDKKAVDAWNIHLVGGLELTIRDDNFPKVLRDLLK